MYDILLVDDDDNLRRSIVILLSKTKEYAIDEAEDGEAAINMINDKQYDLVITDLRMRSTSGMAVLKHVKKINPSTEVIVITGYGTVKSGVEAMKSGAYHYIEKPLNNEEFQILVSRAIEKRQALKQVRFLEDELREKYKFENIVGHSTSMNNVLNVVVQVAKTDSTVLLTGETGTGKELIAKAIHANSPRRQKPMLTINCGALSENLLDSELFGHVKGAFTGAIRDKKGFFQEADTGTVFLDEIGDIAPQTQIRLLRFLQDGEIRRIGENRSLRVDVRLIAATNKDLLEEVKQKNFREDLFFRLNVIPIHLPPIRERKEDIPILANYFLKKYVNKFGKNIKEISPSALSLFMDYEWPGNVREIENVIERSVILASSERIDPEDLSLSFPPNIQKIQKTVHEKKDMTLEEMEKWLILDTYERCKRNQKLTSQKLEVSTTTLWRKLKKYGISLGDKD